MSKAAEKTTTLRTPQGDSGCGRRSSAEQSVEAQLAGLEKLEYRELRNAWVRWFGKEPPPRLSRKLLTLGVGWKIQERAYGGLSAGTKRRLKAISVADRSGTAAKVDPAMRLRRGAQLVREWHGAVHTVLVTDDGFEWQGKVWRSLSVIAREITGQRWSGPRFFGLRSARRSDGRHTRPPTTDSGHNG